MSGGAASSDLRFLPTGDEAGSPPRDRPFRPDVEGLRAVAVGAVVAFHVGLPFARGGYVGVDVFFVISGFVITGLLLRERSSSGGISLRSFWARRARRILPAASLVLVATVLMAERLLGPASGAEAARAGRAASLFLGNFFFLGRATDYLRSSAPPSPLQNYWSLSVEEQFYLFLPLLVLAVGLLARRRAKAALTAAMALVALGSLVWSVHATTSGHAPEAFFAPWTRAFELAAGSLVALSGDPLRRMRPSWASAASWAGLLAIAIAVVGYSTETLFPGLAALLPVVGAALVIAGGTAAPRGGAERLLGLGAMQAVGRLSFSIYLWHWPVLTIAAERSSVPLRPLDRVGLLLLAGLLAILTYRLVEQPVRHATWLVRSTGRSLAVGALLVATSVAISSIVLADATSARSAAGPGTRPQAALGPSRLVAPSEESGCPSHACASALAAVRAASLLGAVPATARPQPPAAIGDLRLPSGDPQSCGWLRSSELADPPCTWGDPSSAERVALVGDSHAWQWSTGVSKAVLGAGGQLGLGFKASCRAAWPVRGLEPSDAPPGASPTAEECSGWVRSIVRWADRFRPSTVVLSGLSPSDPRERSAFAAGVGELLSRLSAPGRRVVLIGLQPILGRDQGPPCLAAHLDDLAACTPTPSASVDEAMRAALRRAARRSGAAYVDPVPWLCDRRSCPQVISDHVAYTDPFHLTSTLVEDLSPVLAVALGIEQAEKA